MNMTGRIRPAGRVRRAAVALAGALLAGVAQAHPWPMPVGQTQAIVTLSHYRTSDLFSRDRDAEPLGDEGEFEKRSLRAFVEHGLREGLTLTGKAELVDQDFGNRFGSSENRGLADPELGLRYALPTFAATGWRQGLMATTKLPLGRDGGDPAIDNHQADIELRYSLGSGLGADGGIGYWFVDLGPRLRRGAPADELRADLGLGVNLNPRLFVLAESFLTFGLRNESRDGAAVTSAPDYDLWVQQLSLVAQVAPRTRIQAGGFMHLWGRNTGAGYGVLVSAWQSF